jgi:hypothetical protein
MLRTKRMMNKKLIRKKRNIKRKTREETRKNSLRKCSIQRKIVHHPMRTMIAIVTQKIYSLWIMKMMKRIMKNKAR